MINLATIEARIVEFERLNGKGSHTAANLVMADIARLLLSVVERGAAVFPKEFLINPSPDLDDLPPVVAQPVVAQHSDAAEEALAVTCETLADLQPGVAAEVVPAEPAPEQPTPVVEPVVVVTQPVAAEAVAEPETPMRKGKKTRLDE